MRCLYVDYNIAPFRLSFHQNPVSFNILEVRSKSRYYQQAESPAYPSPMATPWETMKQQPMATNWKNKQNCGVRHKALKVIFSSLRNINLQLLKTVSRIILGCVSQKLIKKQFSPFMLLKSSSRVKNGRFQ